MKQSAGLLVYRTDEQGRLVVLIVHPSGAYNAKMPWGIPKGEPEPGEALDVTARREVAEETGLVVTGPMLPLGYVDYTKSKKRVFAWAAPLPAGQSARCASWEIDRAEWFTPDDAAPKMQADQRAFLPRLAAVLAAASRTSSGSGGAGA